MNSSGSRSAPEDDPTLKASPAAGGPAPGAPADPSVRPSRAGRNLPAAIGVGVALLAVVLVSLLVVRGAFVIVLVLFAVLGIREVAGAFATAGSRIPVLPAGLGGGAMLVAAWSGGADLLVAATGITVLGLLVLRMREGARGFVRDVTATMFVLAYVPLLGSFVVLMLRPDDGALRVVAFVVGTVASDIGGFAVGVLAGRHRMAPAISPNKSWEGFAGSVATSAVAGWLVVVYGLDGDAWVGVLLGVLIASAATVGDLFESLIKRDLGIKDMGSLLPGHGGMMDRLDSLLFAAPVAWLVLDALVAVS